MKTTVSRRIEWDMGHRIPDHQSLCKHPHGHRYVAEITVEGPVIEEQGSPERGMVKDFSFLKEVLAFIPARWDHSFMVHKEDPFAATLALFEKNHFKQFASDEALRMVQVEFIPTAENIAAEIFRKIKERGINIIKVIIWETPNCKATVTE